MGGSLRGSKFKISLTESLLFNNACFIISVKPLNISISGKEFKKLG